MRLKILNILLFVLGASVLGVLLWQLDLQQVKAHLLRVGPLVFLTTVGLFEIGAVATTTGWWLIIDPAASRARWRDLHKAFWGGYAINALTPGATLGEVYRGMVLRDKVDGAERVASVVSLNFLTTLITQLLTAVGPLAWSLSQPHATWVLWMFGAALAFMLPITLVYIALRLGAVHGVVWLVSRLPLLRTRDTKALLDKARDIDARIQGLRRERPQRFRRIIAMLTLSRIIPVIEVWLLLHALFPARSPGYLGLLALLSQSANQLISWILTFIPGQVGVVEGGAAWLFSRLGLNPVTGMSVELIRRLRTLLCIAIGLVFGAKAGLSLFPAKKKA